MRMVIVISDYISIKKVIEEIEKYMEDPLKNSFFDSKWNKWEKRFYLQSKSFYALVDRGIEEEITGIIHTTKTIKAYTLMIMVRYADGYFINPYLVDLSFSSEEDRDSAYRQILEYFNKVNIKEGIQV